MAQSNTVDFAKTSMMSDPVSLLPDVDKLSGKTYVVRKARIADFGKELQRLGAIGTWDELTIYADEIVFDISTTRPFGFDLTDRSRFTLLARKMTIKGKGRFAVLTVTPGADTVVEIAVQEFVGPPIDFVVADGTRRVSLPETRVLPGHPQRIEARVVLETAVVGENLDRARLGWKAGSEFYWSMVSAFQYGFARIDTDREEARRTFLWVYENTRDASWWEDPSAEMMSMATQSFAMVSRLGQTPPPWPVPLRDHRVLQRTAETRINAAQRLEASYETFVNRETDARARAEAMRRAIVESNAQEKEAARALAAAGEELDRLEKTYRADVQRVVDQNKTLQDLAAAFEKGVVKYQFAQIMKAVSGLGTSLAALGAGAPPTAAVTAVETAVSAAENVGRFAELVAAIKAVAEPVQKLAKIGAVLKDSYKVAMAMKDAMQPGQKLNTFRDDETSAKLTDTDWKVLRERFQGALGSFTQGEDRISGASEYLEGGRVLAIYGEAMYATHLNITRMRERVISLQMKKKAYEAQQARFASYGNSEALTEEMFAQAQLLIRQRYLDVKRGLLFELEDFSDAYRYWALREPSPRKLSLVSRVAEMSELQTDLQSMIDRGLDGLFPVKQQRVFCHIRHELSDEERLMLMRGEQVIVSVRPIRGWARVRIEDLRRVTLDNLTGTPGNEGRNLRCHVHSSGTFIDSWGGKNFEFAAPASQEFGHSFLVEAVKDSDRFAENTILSADGGHQGGDLGQFTNTPFYLPGLYTNWSICLPMELGENKLIDISGVDVIGICFSGWAMSVNAD